MAESTVSGKVRVTAASPSQPFSKVERDALTIVSNALHARNEDNMVADNATFALDNFASAFMSTDSYALWREECVFMSDPDGYRSTY